VNVKNFFIFFYLYPRPLNVNHSESSTSTYPLLPALRSVGEDLAASTKFLKIGVVNDCQANSSGQLIIAMIRPTEIVNNGVGYPNRFHGSKFSYRKGNKKGSEGLN
jgi:hypothetical protein